VQVRGSFDRELEELKQAVLEMGEMTERAITRSIQALKEQDLTLARQIIQDDLEINDRRLGIEERCFALIATRQPAARDLRVIIAAMNLVTELERIADHAKGIATIVIRIGHQPLLKPLIDIPRMAEKSKDMLRRSLQAFIEGDAETAERISQEDDEIDALYDQVYRELLTYMLEDPKTISRATYLLWVAHNLERIADRITNIDERVIYMVTGVLKELAVKAEE